MKTLFEKIKQNVVKKYKSKILKNMPSNNVNVNDFSREFTFYYTNSLEKWRAETFKIKEPETNEWIYKNINSESVFWDVGANIGLFSLFAATCNSFCKIFSFEPEAQNFACLIKNIYQNKFENISPLCIGLNNEKPKIMDLYISEFISGSASHNLGSPSAWSGNKSIFKQKVVAASPDCLVSEFKIPLPSMIKIDVDGLELEILEGASSILDNSVKTILVEMDANDKAEILKMTSLLQCKDFTLVFCSNRTAQLHSKLPRNYIWNKNK